MYIYIQTCATIWCEITWEKTTCRVYKRVLRSTNRLLQGVHGTCLVLTFVIYKKVQLGTYFNDQVAHTLTVTHKPI